MRIAVAADHAGFPLKAPVIEALERDGHQTLNLGTGSTAPVDYPDSAQAVGLALREGRADLGVLLCGSGAGVSIAANKIRGVRAALCHDLFTARQSREDDDANVLCLGARVVGSDMAVALARQFVAARFGNEERHWRRLQKVLRLEASEAAPPGGAAGGGDPWARPTVREAAARLERLHAAARIWKGDASLWSDEPAVQESVVTRLGWLTVASRMREQVTDLVGFAAAIRGEGIADVVLLGMGGSSLAAEVLAATFGPVPGAPRLTVLDTTNPGAVRATLARVRLPGTLFLVSSKSGTTGEMLALYRFFRAEVERQVERPGAHFVAITDAGTPLERLARDAGFRRTFLNDPQIGGRFSALSFFGLVPAALLGVDPARLLHSAAAMAARCGDRAPLADNPGLRLGAILAGLAEAGRDKVTLVLSERLRAFGAWLEQLLTESTGKHGKGLVVVHDEPLGPPAVYGDDRLFVAMTLAGDHAFDAPLADLEAAGHPVVRLALAEPFDLGGEFFRWELATAAAGVVLGINPFDEPNVSQAKDATQAALATFKERGQLPAWPVEGVEDVARVLTSVSLGDYVAWLAYLPPTAGSTDALQRLRTLVRDRTRLATTVGYGPRYLHSTGQLHKGGPPTPILVFLVAGHPEELPIPGETYGFGTLMTAQALGDLATLRAAQRRALWLPVAGEPAEAIDRLTAALASRIEFANVGPAVRAEPVPPARGAVK